MRRTERVRDPAMRGRDHAQLGPAPLDDLRDQAGAKLAGVQQVDLSIVDDLQNGIDELAAEPAVIGERRDADAALSRRVHERMLAFPFRHQHADVKFDARRIECEPVSENRCDLDHQPTANHADAGHGSVATSREQRRARSAD